VTSGNQVTSVGLDNSTQGRDTSGHGLFAQETEKTKHGQSSIVNFRLQSLSLGSLGLVLGQTKGVKQIERNGVGNGSSEFGELSWLSSLHVVRNGEFRVRKRRGHLGVNFQESNEGKDLVLGFDGKGSPLFRRRKISGRPCGAVHLHGPGPDEVGLDAVPDEREHGNTSVLDLGMTQETDGGIISFLPEIPSRNSHGIIVLDNGVQFSSKSLEVGLHKKAPA
jgi:hypothetical protein